MIMMMAPGQNVHCNITTGKIDRKHNYVDKPTLFYCKAKLIGKR